MSKTPFRIVSDHAVRHAVLTDPGGEGAGVDAAEADDAAGLQPLVEMLGGTVVRWIGNVGLEDDADRAVACSRRQVLDVFLVRADIADMREGEGNDLAEIGRIRQDFLISRQRGVEADFGLTLPVAPIPLPSMTVPSARTRRAVGFSVVHGAVAVIVIPFPASCTTLKGRRLPPCL